MSQSDSFTKALVIVHGKSERDIMRYIKSKLRIPLEIYAKDNGSISIEISSVNKILNGRDFQTKKQFLKVYPKIKEKKGRLINFKLFIIMDVDYTPAEQVERYKNKLLFKDHWLYEYIHPILNDNNLEEVLNKLGYTYAKNNKEKKNYKKLFPVERGKQDLDKIEEFRNDLQKIDQSNLDDLLNYCLDNCPKFD